jgi:hypothetical protein
LPGVWLILADVSEYSICSIFKADELEVIQIICLEDGPDRMFRNVGQYKPDTGETPKRKHTESLPVFSAELLFSYIVYPYMLRVPFSMFRE